MKLSSFILKLQAMEKAHGDVEVMRYNDGEAIDVSFIEFDESATLIPPSGNLNLSWNKTVPRII